MDSKLLDDELMFDEKDLNKVIEYATKHKLSNEEVEEGKRLIAEFLKNNKTK